MTTINVLFINYDDDAINTFAPLLDKYEVTVHSASNMLTAIHMLLSGEYSGVSINGDNYEYLPYLKVMRALTPIPIGVAVTHYDDEEYDAAIENGADIYRGRFDSIKHRVRNFSTMVNSYRELSKNNNFTPPAITYHDIQIFPDMLKVFVKGEEVKLQRIEIGILCYLIMNKGMILSHDQIYSYVWGKDYAESPHGALWSHISKIRRKLREGAYQPDFIKTERGIGYSISK